MNLSDREYIALCKRQIEEKFQFEVENGSARQRDLEYLADSIEETSGIKLSLSTLKRLWKMDYDQTPHPSTLQALVSVLGYRDWHEFKLRSKQSSPLTVETPHRRKTNLRWWMLFPGAVAIIVVLWLIAFRSAKPGEARPLVKGAITFTGNKTVTKGVPNTVIFNYDVSQVDADSFFFQQSWNGQEKVKLDPQGHYYSNIYYYPGFHKAKLIANDSILKIFRVHVTTDGWLPVVRYSGTDASPKYVKNGAHLENGALHTTRNDLIASKIPLDKDFFLTYYNVREFGNTHSDNFSLDTRIICDSTNNVACPGFELVVMCETHVFIIGLTGKGCEQNAVLKIGEVYQDGTNKNLAALGRNVIQWQHLRLKVINKEGTVYLDDQPVYSIRFKQDLGKVVGLAYSFSETGAIDYARLSNGEGKLVFDDEFDMDAGKSADLK